MMSASSGTKSEMTEGRAAACASINAMPNPSYNEGNKNASAANLSSRGTSVREAVRQGIHSLDLMKRVAQSCGAIGMGTVDRILRNLRFDLGQRKVLLVFDE